MLSTLYEKPMKTRVLKEIDYPSIKTSTFVLFEKPSYHEIKSVHISKGFVLSGQKPLMRKLIH